jgi:hypothetical protein
MESFMKKVHLFALLSLFLLWTSPQQAISLQSVAFATYATLTIGMVGHSLCKEAINRHHRLKNELTTVKQQILSNEKALESVNKKINHYITHMPYKFTIKPASIPTEEKLSLALHPYYELKRQLYETKKYLKVTFTAIQWENNIAEPLSTDCYCHKYSDVNIDHVRFSLRKIYMAIKNNVQFTDSTDMTRLFETLEKDHELLLTGECEAIHLILEEAISSHIQDLRKLFDASKTIDPSRDLSFRDSAELEKMRLEGNIDDLYAQQRQMSGRSFLYFTTMAAQKVITGAIAISLFNPVYEWVMNRYA